MPPEIDKEISALETQIESQGKLFDLALKEDLELGQAKKILHELKLLRSQLDELMQQKSINSQ